MNDLARRNQSLISALLAKDLQMAMMQRQQNNTTLPRDSTEGSARDAQGGSAVVGSATSARAARPIQDMTD